MDALEAFAQQFLGRSPVIAHVPLDGAVSYIEGVTSVLLFRSGQFQVQMFIVPPNYVIPAHTHPNVDSFEVYVGGDIDFSHGGQQVLPETVRRAVDPLGCSLARGKTIRVRPEDRHGGVFGPSGGVFLSIQHWLNGVRPHCVARDYTGPVMGPDHLAKVVCGDAIAREQADLQASDSL